VVLIWRWRDLGFGHRRRAAFRWGIKMAAEEIGILGGIGEGALFRG
jgi:hypothetical protein